MRLTPETEIIVYGAGYCGAMFVELLQGSQIQPICVFDKDKQKQSEKVFGVEVIEPEWKPADIVVVALLVKGTVYDSIKKYLLELGYDEAQIVHIYDLENQKKLYVSQKLVIKPDSSVVDKYADQWNWLENTLADNESKQVLSAAKVFLGGDTAMKFPSHSIQEQYFAYDIYTRTDNERVIECGGFKGDVMRIFLENNQGKFSHYTLIEPDQKYNSFIEHNMDGYCRDKIEILNYALSDVKQTLYVTNYMNMNSVVSEHKSKYSMQEVQGIPLDDLLPDVECTFLKIDIEGYELKMLQGSKQLIKANKPIIAIAAYHHECDLFEIARVILEYNSEYSLFLRSYMNYQEMILYAIPMQRRGYGSHIPDNCVR